ncbi:cytochrome oxidase assembly protein ShyY1 [Kineococcus radiotolerans]|uniref:SURF1-like protein n=1 Tax=Kineococcus radiotolerans TaxID=131568 RepID=A0A7W4TKI7_KINRA|nr:SURF1 family protein [Kineococcus radiotolerans]MBB2900590.1 cytochrome oxidase assembly protein ShyY1 [Kineococcus radiotolerans]
MPDDHRALNARLAGLGVVALVVALACSVLGIWQWQRGNVVVTEPPAARPVVAVQEVVDAGATGPRSVLSADEVGRRVRVAGTYDPAVDLLVPGRELDGTVGAWALGVVRLPDGSGVPVVRGWVPRGGTAPAPPAGPVDLTGTLQPPEGSDLAPSSAALPAGQTWIVSAADLVNRVDYPVANAYVTDAAPPAGLRPVPAEDPGQASRRLDWRNLAYAAQWWVFALFAVVLWVRVVRDERADVGDDPGEDDAGDGSDDEQVDGSGGRDMSGAR